MVDMEKAFNNTSKEVNKETFLKHEVPLPIVNWVNHRALMADKGDSILREASIRVVQEESCLHYCATC